MSKKDYICGLGLESEDWADASEQVEELASEVYLATEPLRILQAVALYVDQNICYYDPSASKLSLAESKVTKRGVCTHLTAWTAIAGTRLAGGTWHPTIESVPSERGMHALNTVSKNGELYTCDNFSGVDTYGRKNSNLISARTEAEDFIAASPLLLEEEGIVQIRVKNNHAAHALMADECRAEFLKTDCLVLTLFNGDEGMVAYTALLDRFSSRAASRPPSEEFEEVVLPRLT